MGDRIHYKVTFEVPERYNFTQEDARAAWGQFAQVQKEDARTYRVEDSISAHALAFREAVRGVMGYVETSFAMPIEIIEVWVKLEKDE